MKVKFADFTQTTLEESLPTTGETVKDHFTQLVVKAWEREGRPVRLLGLGVRLLDLREESVLEQLELFEKKAIGLG